MSRLTSDRNQQQVICQLINKVIILLTRIFKQQPQQPNQNQQIVQSIQQSARSQGVQQQVISSA